MGKRKRDSVAQNRCGCFVNLEGIMLPKILFVDDEASLLNCYSYVFNERYRVVAASSGREALRQAKLQQDIDLAVVDFRLPDISGVEVLTEIKGLRPSVPVLMVTAYGNEDLAVKALRCGAKDYIKKPFSPEELAEKIDFFLSLTGMDGICRKAATYRETKWTDAPGDPSGNLWRIRKVIQFLDGNYMAKTSLRNAADQACLSGRHFSRTFKKATGTSYRDYVNRLRVEKAGEMLRMTAHTITMITQAVGYCDLTDFERIFKKITGKTPSQYRTSKD
jgi:YesN/AraC family two-component response regulator